MACFFFQDSWACSGASAVSDNDTAKRVASSVLSAFNDPFVWNNHEFFLSAIAVLRPLLEAYAQGFQRGLSLELHVDRLEHNPQRLRGLPGGQRGLGEGGEVLQVLALSAHVFFPAFLRQIQRKSIKSVSLKLAFLATMFGSNALTLALCSQLNKPCI